MYLTGGQYKGHKIEVPKNVKPTLSKVRESVFNILMQYDLSGNKFLTYEDKYVGGGKGKVKGGKMPVKSGKGGMASALRKLPAKLDKDIQEKVEEVAMKSFKVLGSGGNCRIDFLIDDKKKTNLKLSISFFILF